jgi:hypothetical protein
MKFKSRFFRLCLIFCGLFFALFLARLLYGYYFYPDGRPSEARPSGISLVDSGYAAKKNYAGSQYTVAGQRSVVDQKYEKIASLRADSARFSEDEGKAREAVAAHNGIIQFETGLGTEGNRVLSLVVGVQPERFDSFCQALRGIGSLRSMEASKTDKTNEFLDLKAKRASLEKTRAALMDLRTRGGNIDELLKLQNRILEIEEQLQSLGVQLGDFDEVNAFCTVRFALHESVSGRSSISLRHRLSVAFIWAAEVYLGLMLALCLTMLAAFLSLLAADRLGIVRGVLATLESKKE